MLKVGQPHVFENFAVAKTPTKVPAYCWSRMSFFDRPIDLL